MRLARMLALLIFVNLPLASFADTMATFGNNDGKFSATSSAGPLTLSGSFLTQITGLSPLIPDQTMAFITGINNCATAGCLGSVTLTTGAYVSSPTSTHLVHLAGDPVSGVNVNFGAGGNFSVVGAGFIFNGTFSGATWTCSIAGASTCNGQGAGGQWFLNATLASGTLSVGSNVYSVAGGGSVQLTALGTPIVTRNGAGTITGITWKDNSGTTSFLSPIPEPGTLTLLGSGLVGIAMFTKRRLAKSKGHTGA